MSLFKNLLALIGLAVLIGAGYGYSKLAPIMAEFDPGYMKIYTEFATALLKTRDPGEAMMWAVPVEDSKLTVDEVKDSLKSLASARNFLFVGEAPFYKQVEAVTGQKSRHISFLSFCDVMVGKMMADYRDAYTGFMPCRVAVVEDKSGKIWLYTMNLDMMIHGGRRLPEDLRKEALRIRNVIWEIVNGAAKGEF
ncbi:DUF302 domain-containing protein [Candidatus Magnetaquicoccus inordinatus]|uniref:DUF302 domain-containing protein n=1 Tax=Candidatus Magnetaquicoccus inordinatus TaxID=2496818 RepID=UPI00102C78BD|nr:DUF302 domain-containing protein [Candidatus Magnetaquicoccus inordinatus]